MHYANESFTNQVRTNTRPELTGNLPLDKADNETMAEAATQ